MNKFIKVLLSVVSLPLSIVGGIIISFVCTLIMGLFVIPEKVLIDIWRDDYYEIDR